MNTFEKYFNKDKDDVRVAKKDLIFGKVKRGFETAVGQLEEARIDLELETENIRVRIANGNIDGVITLGEKIVEMDDLRNVITALKLEVKAFVGE